MLAHLPSLFIHEHCAERYFLTSSLIMQVIQVHQNKQKMSRLRADIESIVEQLHTCRILDWVKHFLR
jgi:hypothetical protein